MGMRRRRRKKIWLYFALLLLVGVALPLSLPKERPGEKGGLKPLAFAEPDLTVRLYRTAADKTVELDLEEYLLGVVAAEAPANFSFEALKAQAIVARTYTARKIVNGADEGAKTGGANLCDSYAHCQAYCDDAEMREKWGGAYEENLKKIAAAVAETRGQIVLYEGEIALTPYHSTCGGHTASAEEVWGKSYPYLVGVDCDWDREAPRYREDFTFSLADLPWLLGEDGKPCVAQTGTKAVKPPKVSGKTGSGRVKTVFYGGLTFEATAFRSKMGINSTNFSFDVDGDRLIVHTQGYGHGVGMCQHGANGLGAAGWTAEEIILHYYPGVTIDTLK